MAANVKKAYSKPSPISSSDYNENADLETSSENYAKRFSGKIGQYFLDVQEKITLDLLSPFQKANVLDIGGGHAQLVAPLINNGFKVTVVGSDDICRERLDKLLGPDSFKYYTCNLLRLPFEDNQFDIVMAFRLFAHISQWQMLIAEMCRVAQKTIIIDYPDIRSFNITYKWMFQAKKVLEGNTRPYFLFARKQLIQEFEKFRFDKPVLKPQFFVPMVIHRMFSSVPITKTIEWIGGNLGLTSLFGSPIIMRVTHLPE